MRSRCFTILLLSFLATARQLNNAQLNGSWPTVRVTLDNITYAGITRNVLSQRGGGREIVPVNVYYGIPFALPPRRFSLAEPVPPSSIPIERNAITRPPACMQANPANPNVPESEDCLTMNIFVSAKHQPKSLLDLRGKGIPIMLFLYGGGFQNGDSSLDMYMADVLVANQDVMVAIPNYRLNVFGFPGWTTVDKGNETPNLGLHDQREAMRFVKRHARAFGGDPTKITLFGQSAGARSADMHILTMGLGLATRGHKEELPFRAVIMQSGSSELVPLADRRKARHDVQQPPFLKLAELVGCSLGSMDRELMNCMRRISGELLKNMTIEHSLYFPTIFDNGLTTVRDQYSERLLRPFNNVPILMGTNANEGSSMIYRESNNDIDQFIEDVIGFIAMPDWQIKAKRRELMGIYGGPFPNARYKSVEEAMTAIETDLAYTCITSREAFASAEGGIPSLKPPTSQQPGALTWRYLFNASFPSSEKFPGSGAYHGVEIPFVFGSLRNSTGKLTDDEVFLSMFVQKLWADFAKDPEHSLPWSKVGSPENDLGIITREPRIRVTNSSTIDRNCKVFEPFYTGRA